MTTTPPNPLLAGFHPDPSVTRVGEEYLLATSTFEYLPGLPVYRSRDLATWDLAGHVVNRAEQVDVRDIPTAGGLWAPTIRHHDDRLWVAVTDAMGRGTLIFTADDPSGPWSDGVVVAGVDGIDPDLAWDTDGTCYLTYSALRLSSGAHDGIEQVRVDPVTGTALSTPRSLWSGTGLMFPESPHLYRIGDWWYLLIAEGGTERGHAVSVARSRSPEGPFEGCPGNPVLTAAGTARPVQNTGHGDLVEAPDGTWYLVLLGMRVRGATRSFSPMGRETFATPVTWRDGWPHPAPVTLSEPSASVTWQDDFAGDRLDPRWLAVRRPAAEFSRLQAGGGLTLEADGSTLADPRPVFLGARQAHLRSRLSARIETGEEGAGGVAMRYDERHYVTVEVAGGQVVAGADVAGIGQRWPAPLPAGHDDGVTVWIATAPPAESRSLADRLTSDVLELGFDGPDGPVTLARVDGRYFTAETTASFTGRVTGVYAAWGTVSVTQVRYEGSDV